jgi:dCTP deaminase
VHAADLLRQPCAERAARRGGADGVEDDRRRAGRAGYEPREAEQRRRPEEREHGERGQAAAADLVPPGLASPAAELGVVDVRCNRQETRDGNRRIAPVVLSDATIARYLAEGRIEIDPYDESLLQPSSVDVRVDAFFRVFHNNRYPFIDVKVEQAELTELVEVDGEHPFVLHPGEFVLGSTLERVRLPDDLVARLEGKSSLGRLGLLIHSTAGFIDPGWDGHVTLELSNVANLPITIYPGMKIGQISFMQMTEPAARPYGSSQIGSKYKGQKGPTPSRYFKNFEGGE